MKIIKKKLKTTRFAGQFDCGIFHISHVVKVFYLLNIILIFYWRNFIFCLKLFFNEHNFWVCDGGVSCSVHNYKFNVKHLFLMFEFNVDWDHHLTQKNINLSWNLSLFPKAKVQKFVYNLSCVCDENRKELNHFIIV